MVTPFDKGQAKAIEKAIRESDLGLDPAHQGGVIRVPLPSMNEQRRKELVKVLHKLAEDGRIAIRHARTDARDKIKKLDGVSEDDKKHAEKDLQKLHDDFIGKLDVDAEGEGSRSDGGLSPRARTQTRDATRIHADHGAGLRRRSLLVAHSRARSGAATHRDHHGRQRPLGARAAHAAPVRPSRRA